jgi:tetratricopeptide (TPR) repeat protein
LNTDNFRASNLFAVALRQLGDREGAAARLKRNWERDPLDWWTRHLSGERLSCDLQTALDLAHDYARAGLFGDALDMLESATAERRDLPDQSWGALPMVHYTSGWLELKRGNVPAAQRQFRKAAAAPRDYCFPARLEEIAILESAMRLNAKDARAPYYLGNLLYDRRRHEDAIQLWERSVKLDPTFSIAWRNLGIGYFNIRKQPSKARRAYDRAFRANPKDARLLYERDQLWKRTGEKPARRLREFEKFPDLVRARDDLSIELCALLNQAGRHRAALERVQSRHFQPWEGGEGGPLGQHVRSHLALGRQALSHGKRADALKHFEAALTSPPNLGEARHLLANNSDIHYWVGCTLAELGREDEARKHWTAAATFKGDFQEMSVRTFSEQTCYSAFALEALGRKASARRLLRQLLEHGRRLARTPAKIDYFATSLPTMLLFEDDLQARQEITALFLQAQALLGLGDRRRGRRLLAEVIKRDPNHALAADFMTP